MSFFTKIKDTSVSFAAEKILKKFIEKYGELQDLSIDSVNKRIQFKAALKGEKEPVIITISDYEFIDKKDKTFLQINHLISSREWINLIVEDFVTEKEIEIPSKYAGILKFLL